MMVYFRKQISEKGLGMCNELIAKRGTTRAIEAVSSLLNDNDSVNPDAEADNKPSLDNLVKPSNWPEGKNCHTEAHIRNAKSQTSHHCTP